MRPGRRLITCFSGQSACSAGSGWLFGYSWNKKKGERKKRKEREEESREDEDRFKLLALKINEATRQRK